VVWAQPVGRASVLYAVFKQYERMGKTSKKRGPPEELPKEPRQEPKPLEKMSKAELIAAMKAIQAKDAGKEEGKLVCLLNLLARLYPRTVCQTPTAPV